MSGQTELREKLWYGVPFKQALQDATARFATGYKYAELKEMIADPENEDVLDNEELESVDRQVNLLLHMYVFYHSYTPQESTDD